MPVTPYGAAKAYSFFIVRSYRRRYGLHASSGILYNHESPRRPLDFLPRKVANGRRPDLAWSQDALDSVTSTRDVTGATPVTTCGRCG